MARSNVSHLRPVAKPYDHEAEDVVWVAATPMEWSVIAAAVERSPFLAAREPMRRIAAEVVDHQLARMKADIVDANADYLGGA